MGGLQGGKQYHQSGQQGKAEYKFNRFDYLIHYSTDLLQDGVDVNNGDARKSPDLVLARNWKRFTDAQKAEYVEEFKKYLTNSYGSRIERYDQQKVEIVGEREEPRGDVVIQTKIVGGEFEGTLVDYRLRKQKGEWRVIDVVIEGISMVSNYRDQFKSIVSAGGPELLLEKLKEKNAAGMEIH